MQGLDFTSSDHVDAARFNRILWAGLKGEDVPYPTVRSGLDLRKNRARLLAKVAKEQAKQKQHEHAAGSSEYAGDIREDEGAQLSK
jgi:hypothetical protein